MKHLALSATLLLTACGIGDRPQIVTYMVNTPAKLETSSCKSKLALQVLEPSTSPGLDSVRIPVMKGEQQLDYYSGVKWAAPAPVMMQSVLVNSFEKSGVFTSVSTESEVVHNDLQLTTDIRDFQVTDTQKGHIQIRLVSKLVNMDSRKVLATIPVEKSLTPKAYKMEEIVAAFNSAASEAAGEIVAASIAAQPKCKSTK